MIRNVQMPDDVEETDENHAIDLNGDHYELVDDVWQNNMPEGEQQTI